MGTECGFCAESSAQRECMRSVPGKGGDTCVCGFCKWSSYSEYLKYSAYMHGRHEEGDQLIEASCASSPRTTAYECGTKNTGDDNTLAFPSVVKQCEES